MALKSSPKAAFHSTTISDEATTVGANRHDVDWILTTLYAVKLYLTPLIAFNW